MQTNSHSTGYYAGLFFLLMAHTMGGINIVGAKYLVSTISIPTILVLRFSLAAIILLAIYFTTATPKKMLNEIKQVDRVGWGYVVADTTRADERKNYHVYYFRDYWLNSN